MNISENLIHEFISDLQEDYNDAFWDRSNLGYSQNHGGGNINSQAKPEEPAIGDMSGAELEKHIRDTPSLFAQFGHLLPKK